MLKLKCLTITFSLLIQSTLLYGADADTVMANQKAACDKNTAMEWSASLNRCVAKQAAIDTRKAVSACDSITDLKAKEKCHMDLAEKNSGLSSDTGSLNKGNTSKSMLMNSVTTAYTMINFISNSGKDGEKSACTSKKILGVTSIAGLASDIFLKMKAKKKVKELENKYKLDTTTGTTEAQVKALEYLREEQQTVVEIASMEKKRNMLLMLGYGMAAAWAIYEMTPFGAANADCNRPETKKDEDAKSKMKEEAAPDPKPANATSAQPAGTPAEAVTASPVPAQTPAAPTPLPANAVSPPPPTGTPSGWVGPRE